MKKLVRVRRRLMESIGITRTFRNFLYLLTSYLGLFNNKNPLIAVLWEGTRFNIGSRDHNLLKGFTEVVRDIWEEDVYHLSKGDLVAPKVIVDVGAHLGVFSILAAKKFPDASVYSFEPDPRNFELLSRNISLNGLEDRIHQFQVAISSKNGILSFFRSGSLSISHSLFERKFTVLNKKNYEEVKVRSFTLKDAFDRSKIKFCDLLKIDCEGAEFEILFGAPPDILRKIKKIVLEYHDGITDDNHNDLAKFLGKNRFLVEVKPFNNTGNVSRGILSAKPLPLFPSDKIGNDAHWN
jgi:FkbM family methyltransferase